LQRLAAQSGQVRCVVDIQVGVMQVRQHFLQRAGQPERSKMDLIDNYRACCLRYSLGVVPAQRRNARVK
jgi:hypothetical protein